MADLTHVTLRQEMAPFHAALEELGRLVPLVPDGLDRARALVTAGGPYIEWSDRVEGRCMVQTALPGARLAALLSYLRRAAGEVA